MSRPDSLNQACERLLQTRQAQRLPSIAAAVVRAGEVVWSGAVGYADWEGGVLATPGTQYRIGSITKTFTAVAVMQLRDGGFLDLDDRLEQHIDGIAPGSPTIRQLVAHLSGLRREAGEMFVTGATPSVEDVLGAYERVLPAARAHHYSNLAFALLGEVVARRSGTPYMEYVDTNLIAPLDLSRTTWYEQRPNAQGYLVDEWAGTAAREPHSDMGGVAAMGQLWSTVGDLCAWASFLVDGREGVLSPESADELWSPQVMVNPDEWVVGWGLGLELQRRGERVFGGHGGAMPGFLAGVYINRKTRTGAAALTNSGTQGVKDLALDLVSTTIDLWPADVGLWTPEAEPPAEIRSILGRWWSEGSEFTFCWRDAKLEATVEGAASWQLPAVFERVGEREYRGVSGRERGELLRIEDDRLVWAGYAFTRLQEPSAG